VRRMAARFAAWMGRRHMDLSDWHAGRVVIWMRRQLRWERPPND
jgi:hypothetical protein